MQNDVYTVLQILLQASWLKDNWLAQTHNNPVLYRWYWMVYQVL